MEATATATASKKSEAIVPAGEATKTKRHRNSVNKQMMLRHPAIKRASLKAGILRLSDKVYPIVFNDTEQFIKTIMQDALVYKGSNRKTVSSKHIRAACLKNGEHILDSTIQ